MAEWHNIDLVVGCVPPPDKGTIRLPKGTPLTGRRLLLEAGQKKKVLKRAVREDNGTAACLGGSDYSSLGVAAKARCREIGFARAILGDESLRLSAAIAVTTVLATVLTALATFERNSTDDSHAFTRTTALVILVLACGAAILKFVKEYREL